MFFQFNQKSVEDAIREQKARAKEAKKALPTFEYEGHKLKFLMAQDGIVVIDSDPSLIKEVEGDKNADHGRVDRWTQTGWEEKD